MRTFPFDATLDGVRSYLPWLEISETSVPSEEQILQFLNDISSQVELRIGDINVSLAAKPDFLDRVQRQARHVVYLGTSASAQDAGNPERAEVGGAGYAAVLWDRYEKALERLSLKVEEYIAEVEADAAVVNYPEIESSPPMFSVNMPF